MFAFIKGILNHSSSIYVIIETSGIGYKIFIPASTFVNLPQIGSEIHLHLSFVVREQAQALYGFQTIQERDFFESLVGVTGIGPKTALALIGHMPLSELSSAILQEDVVALCRVPGIGKKGAERLIVELRDKIPGQVASDMPVTAQSDSHAQMINDAMCALINLGYTQINAQKAIKKCMKEIPEGIDVSTLISTALKHV